MSSTQEAKDETSAISINLFKQQEERFRMQNQKMAKLANNLATFDKILHKAKQHRSYKTEVVQKTEDGMRKVRHEIGEITKEQRAQFEALSNEDRRRMCELAGLEYLKSAFSTVDEVLLARDTVKTSGESKDWPDGEVMSEDTKRRAEESRGDGIPSEPSQHQNNFSHEDENDPWLRTKQAGTTQIPHRRVEALRGFAMPQLKPQSSQPPLHQEVWPLVEGQSQIVSPVHLNPSLGSVDIEEMLRENLEKQRIVKVGLRRSEEDILQTQEDIRKAEEREGGRVSRVNFNVEDWLRAREVEDFPGSALPAKHSSPR